MENKLILAVKEKVRRHGYKLTGPRMAIIEYMMEENGHPDVQEIYEGIRTISPGIGIATVYRTVDLLLRLGILRALTLKDSHIRYEINWPEDHHHHLVCTGCMRITEFGNCNFRLIAGEVEQVSRYKIYEHTLEAYGLCPQCANEEI